MLLMKFLTILTAFLVFITSGVKCQIPTLVNNATMNISDMVGYSKIFKDKNGTVENLLKDLFQYYDKRVRPFANNDLPVIVNTTLKQGFLIKLETNNQLFDSVVYHDQRWVDPRLAWDPQQYNNITSIAILANLIWVPRASVYNSMSIEEIMDENSLEVRLNYNGLIRLLHPQYLSCTCKIDIERFPFDTQFCTVSLESPTLTTSEMDVNILQPDADSYFDGNMEFDVMNATLYYDKLLDNGAERAVYYYVFQIERRSSYYIGVIVVPTFLTMALSILGIFAPGTSAEEDVNKGLSTFFALTVLLSIVADSLPKSDKLPLLGIFVLINIIICVLTVLVAMLIGWLKDKLIASGKKPSYIVCRIFFIPYEKSLTQISHKNIENDYSSYDSNNNFNKTTNGDLPANREKMNELDIFKSALRSLIDAHKENLTKIQNGNQPETLGDWELVFYRVDLLLLALFEILISINLIVFISYSWAPKPPMFETFLDLYYGKYYKDVGIDYSKF